MEGMNEFLRDQARMQAASMGMSSGGSEGDSGNIPVTGDIGSDTGVKIERVTRN
jgi:hypothetical protein